MGASVYLKLDCRRLRPLVGVHLSPHTRGAPPEHPFRITLSVPGAGSLYVLGVVGPEGCPKNLSTAPNPVLLKRQETVLSYSGELKAVGRKGIYL